MNKKKILVKVHLEKNVYINLHNVHDSPPMILCAIM